MNVAWRVLLLALAYAVIVALVVLLAGCAAPKKKAAKSTLRIYRCGELIYSTEAVCEEKPCGC